MTVAGRPQFLMSCLACRVHARGSWRTALSAHASAFWAELEAEN